MVCTEMFPATAILLVCTKMYWDAAIYWQKLLVYRKMLLSTEGNFWIILRCPTGNPLKFVYVVIKMLLSAENTFFFVLRCCYLLKIERKYIFLCIQMLLSTEDSFWFVFRCYFLLKIAFGLYSDVTFYWR